MHKALNKISAFVLALTVIAVTHATVTDPVKPKCTESDPTKACSKMCVDWRNGGGDVGTFEANCQDCCGQMGQPTAACMAACSNDKMPCDCKPKQSVPVE